MVRNMWKSPTKSWNLGLKSRGDYSNAGDICCSTLLKQTKQMIASFYGKGSQKVCKGFLDVHVSLEDSIAANASVKNWQLDVIAAWRRKGLDRAGGPVTPSSARPEILWNLAWLWGDFLWLHRYTIWIGEKLSNYFQLDLEFMKTSATFWRSNWSSTAIHSDRDAGSTS